MPSAERLSPIAGEVLGNEESQMKFHGLAVAAIALVTTGAFAQNSATLLHRYDFNTDVRDTVGGVDGTLNGGAEIVDGALHTDGSSGFVQFPSKIIPVEGSFSVALWFKTQSISSPYAVVELISQGCSGCPGFYIGRDETSAWRNWHDFANGTGQLSAPFPALNAWHHVAVVVDRAANTSTLWVDGVATASLPPASMTTGGTATRLARQFGGYGEYHHGFIDDVRVYSGALRPGEIAQLSSHHPPTSAGYALRVTTFYVYGGAGDRVAGPSGCPDTGFARFTNLGAATLAGTFTLRGTAPNGGYHETSFVGSIAPNVTLGSLSISCESSNDGGYNKVAGQPDRGVEIRFDGTATIGSNSSALHLSVVDVEVQ